MRFVLRFVATLCVVFVSYTSAISAADNASMAGVDGRGLIDLWSEEQPAFGQFVMPADDSKDSDASSGYTVQTGLDLAANSLLDFAFLSLEQEYDAQSAHNVAQGIREGAMDGEQLPLLVRIPPIYVDGEDAARARVQELLSMGANGVVIPHVMDLDEARAAISFFEGANVWSPSNPDGNVVAMLIIEDPDVFTELEEIANLPGFSALVCGIGSLTSALGGDRDAAEAINQQVLAESKRVGKPNLTTVDPGSVELRVEQGFLGLLAYGPESQASIKRGRAAAGR